MPFEDFDFFASLVSFDLAFLALLLFAVLASDLDPRARRRGSIAEATEPAVSAALAAALRARVVSFSSSESVLVS